MGGGVSIPRASRSTNSKNEDTLSELRSLGHGSKLQHTVEQSQHGSEEKRKNRKISYVLKRENSFGSDEEKNNALLEEMSEINKLEVLKFASLVGTTTNMMRILEIVDKTFRSLFLARKVMIHLNPEYAARYNRHLRRYSHGEIGRAKPLMSSLEIGFEQRLSSVCGVRSLGTLLRENSGSNQTVDVHQLTKRGKESAFESEKISSLACPISSTVEYDNSSLIETERHTRIQPHVRHGQHQIFAICEINREELDAGFVVEDARLLAALCIYLGRALERSCIESDLTRNLEWSSMMLKMSQTLNANLDALALIQSAIKMLCDALFAERGSMYMVDDSVNPPDLWTMVTGNEDDCEELRELRIPFGRGVAGYVAEHKESVIIPDAYEDERFDREVDKRTGLKTTSMLCVPIFSHKNEMIAVVQMVNKKDTDGKWTAAFDQDDADNILAFSSHISVALQNAKEKAINRYNEEIANGLLDKMFPKHITEKLKRKNERQVLAHTNSSGKRFGVGVPQEPIVENYSRVFVFFSDIVSFTTLSMVWEPYEVVNLLNDLFTQFDFLSAQHHVYKLETIGDAYVACSNLPFMNEKSERQAAENLARFAVDATELVKRFETRTGKRIQIRAGIHCGPCFGGVVGFRMPRFCLMGDTMNTASRMESTSTACKVHISEDFKAVLDDSPTPNNEPDQSDFQSFAKFNFEELGPMDIKGKGIMKTFYLNPPDNAPEGFYANQALQQATQTIDTRITGRAPASPMSRILHRPSDKE